MITLHNVYNLKRMVHGSYDAEIAQKWGITNYRGQKCQHVEFIPLSELLADPKLWEAKIYSLEYVVKISWSFVNVWESYGQNRTWGVKSVNVKFYGFSGERKIKRGHYHVGKCPKVLKNQIRGFTSQDSWPNHRNQSTGTKTATNGQTLELPINPGAESANSSDLGPKLSG